MFIPHYVSCVMCHVSRVTCHLLPVTCHMSHDFFYFFTLKKVGQSGATSWWRVCYQRGLPRLVCIMDIILTISNAWFRDCSQIISAIFWGVWTPIPHFQQLSATSSNIKSFLEPAVPPIILFLIIDMMPLKRCVVKENYFISFLRNEARNFFFFQDPDSL